MEEDWEIYWRRRPWAQILEIEANIDDISRHPMYRVGGSGEWQGRVGADMTACRHVSHSGAGSRGGVVPNPRHCTKIPPGGRRQGGGGPRLTRGQLSYLGLKTWPCTTNEWRVGGGGWHVSLPPCESLGGRQPVGETSLTPGTVRKYRRVADGRAVTALPSAWG